MRYVPCLRIEDAPNAFTPSRTRSGARKRFEKRDRHPHARPGRSARLACGLVLRVRRAGNVEMGPRWTIDELLQKQRSADRAAPPPARIFHVRPFAADQILVIVPDGQAPQALTSSLATFNQLPSQLIVIRKQSR